MTMVNQSTEKLKAKNNNKTTMLKQLKIKNIYCMWQLNIKTPEKKQTRANSAEQFHTMSKAER